MMRMLVGGCVGSFYSHWATFCLLRGTRPTKELKVNCLGWKHTCWAMLHQGQAAFFVWRVSSCAWADDNWHVGVVSFGPLCKNRGLVDQRRPPPSCWLSLVVVRRLSCGWISWYSHCLLGSACNWPAVGWLRPGSGPTTWPVFYGALFLFVPCLGCAEIQLSYLAGHPFHRTNTGT